MKYYKTPDQKIHALDDESFAYLLPLGAEKCSEGEMEAANDALRADADQALAVAAASEALLRSDTTVLRCSERAIPMPAEWIAYREALRLIVRSGQGALPEIPPYPNGS